MPASRDIQTAQAYCKSRLPMALILPEVMRDHAKTSRDIWQNPHICVFSRPGYRAGENQREQYSKSLFCFAHLSCLCQDLARINQSSHRCEDQSLEIQSCHASSAFATCGQDDNQALACYTSDMQAADCEGHESSIARMTEAQHALSRFHHLNQESNSSKHV